MYNFSFVNHDMISPCWGDTLRLNYNLVSSQIATNASLFMTPTFDPSIMTQYPQFGAFGNGLLNPMLAINQTMQSFGNGWNMGGFNFGNFQNMFQTNPWGNWTTGGGNNSNLSEADQLKQKQYDKLKAILTNYKNASKDDATNAIIQEALNKSGKIDEKLEALKDACKQLNSSKLEQALLSLDNIKIDLSEAGYNLGVINKKDDTELTQTINKVENELKNKDMTTLNSTLVSSTSEPQILRYLSYWNDKYNSSNNKGIIRLIANNIPAKDDEQTLQKAGVNNIAMSLVNYVDTLKAKFDSEVNFAEIEKSAKAVQDALTTANKNFTKANLETLANKVDDLYARLRLAEAERIQNKVKTQYGFLNEAIGKNIVDDDLIIGDVKKDLQAEKINIPSNLDGVPNENNDSVTIDDDIDGTCETDKEKLKKLIDKKYLDDKPVVEGVYKSKVESTNESPKFYMILNDKLVELKDVKSIDKTSKNCTMKDGTTKSFDEAKANAIEVTAADVQKYKNTVDRIDNLVNNGYIKACNNLTNEFPKGVKLYRSIGKGLDKNYQYFIVKDNEFVKVNAKSVNAKGYVTMDDNSVKHISQLTDNNFTSVENNEILKEDETEDVSNDSDSSEETSTVDTNTTGEMRDLADELGLESTDVIGYYKKGNNYYKYNTENEKFEALSDVKEISSTGIMTKKDGSKVTLREVESPEAAGKTLREKLAGNTPNEDYKVIERKLNSFSTYDNIEDIVKFVESYESERAWYCFFNSKICAQICSELELSNDTKVKYLRVLCKKFEKVALKAGLSSDSNEIKNLKEIINCETIRPEFIIDEARVIDTIIEKIIKEYREKYPENNEEETGLNTEA